MLGIINIRKNKDNINIKDNNKDYIDISKNKDKDKFKDNIDIYKNEDKDKFEDN